MVNLHFLAAWRKWTLDPLFKVDIVQKVLKALIVAFSVSFALVRGLCHFNGARAQIYAACDGPGGE